jgi:hypothetical protein
MCLGRGGWSAREELHLLDAIEQFGFGNWEDISRHIETRSPEGIKWLLYLIFCDLSTKSVRCS